MSAAEEENSTDNDAQDGPTVLACSSCPLGLNLNTLEIPSLTTCTIASVKLPAISRRRILCKLAYITYVRRTRS